MDQHHLHRIRPRLKGTEPDGAPRWEHANDRAPLRVAAVRAWAASRVLGRDRASAGDVLAHARSLPARDATAVATGAVRAVDYLDPDHARTVLNAALNWGHKAPRKAALERLLVHGEHDRVRTLTDNDPDASIRRWADKQLNDNGGQGSMFD